MHRLILALLLLGAAPAFAADLALKRVMLSSAGVGYFEYEAEVDGPATLGLDVPLDQVDDVLISLVVFDSARRGRHGGAAGTRQHACELRQRAVRPRGAAIGGRLPEQPAGRGDQRAGPASDDRPDHARRACDRDAAGDRPASRSATVQRTRVTVLGPEGMRQFVLEEADSIQVTDPDLRARIGQALDSLRREANQSVRHHHAAQHRQRPSHGSRRLRRRGATVEGVVSAGAAGEGRRSRAAAGLGGAGEPVRRRLERRRADAAIRQPGHIPAGDLSELLRAAAGGAGGDPGPHPAETSTHGARPWRSPPQQKAAPAAPHRAWRPWPRLHRMPMAHREPRTWRRRRNRWQAAEGAEETIFQLPTPVVAGRRPHRQRADHRSQPSPPRGWIWRPATTRIRCRRSASPTTPARRCPPAC